MPDRDPWEHFLSMPPDDLWDRVDPDRPHRDMDGNPISFRTWCVLVESSERILAQDHVGPYFISTVWLGIDHGYGLDCPPLIFETMVFKGRESDVECRRYSTREQAEEGHAALLRELKLIEDATR